MRTGLAVVAAVMTLSAWPAAAQAYPTRPIRLIIPLPPGGGADFIGRVIGQKLSEQLGQPMIADNRGGASGAIAGELAARAAPDGYTLFLGYAASHGINPALSKLPYDALNDFTPVTYMAQSQNIVSVHPSFAPNSIKELIAAARAKPGQIVYASAGFGSATHLSAVLLAQMTGVSFTHVPHKGAGPALIDLIGGHVQFAFASLPAALPHTRAGKLKALAVSGLKRSPTVPDLPTVAEGGLPGFETNQWYVLLGPAKLPAAIVQRLNAETNKALNAADVRAKLEPQGFEIEGTTPEAAREHIRSELAKWAKVVAGAGIKAEAGR
ncbi:MAG: tripartite tricarboxylate transporter substrate binding protein [Betaproteobacteria bacterium]|nr:tripartite tricarboxylate transporter substrate binding protein [Betaproteobacteria bacterium]